VYWLEVQVFIVKTEWLNKERVESLDQDWKAAKAIKRSRVNHQMIYLNIGRLHKRSAYHRSFMVQ